MARSGSIFQPFSNCICNINTNATVTLASKADEGTVSENKALTLKQTHRVGPDIAGLSEVCCSRHVLYKYPPEEINENHNKGWPGQSCCCRHLNATQARSAAAWAHRLCTVHLVYRQNRVYDFKLSPCCVCCIPSFGWSPASECYLPTFWNIHTTYGTVPKRRHVKFRRRGITQAKDYNKTAYIYSCRVSETSHLYVLSPYRKETSSEACQWRAIFQQNRDASCHQVSFPARQRAEGNPHHNERNISLFPSWSG